MPCTVDSYGQVCLSFITMHCCLYMKPICKRRCLSCTAVLFEAILEMTDVGLAQKCVLCMILINRLITATRFLTFLFQFFKASLIL